MHYVTPASQAPHLQLLLQPLQLHVTHAAAKLDKSPRHTHQALWAVLLLQQQQQQEAKQGMLARQQQPHTCKTFFWAVLHLQQQQHGRTHSM
jgi:hypothetical protein